MRYCGGGVGHKYMWEIEVKYENMSLERSHWNLRSNPPPGKNAHVDGASNSGSQEGQQPKLGGESDDGDYVPPQTGDSGNDSSSCEEDSDDDGLGDSGGDSDEIGSDVSHESYGLADL